MTQAFAEIGADSASALDRFRARFHPEAVAPGTYADATDIVLFIHIPKTAGMSLGKSLRAAFDTFHGVEWNRPAESFRQLTNQALYARMTARPGRQVIAGHYGWGEMSIWRNQELPVKAISVIRHPLDRFVSNYNYGCSPKHPDNQGFKARFPTMLSYAQNLETDFQIRRMVGMIYSFDHALEKLTRYYSFLGVTEKLDASLGHLSRSHGLPAMRSYQLNKAASAPGSAKVPPKVRKIVLDKSVNDLRLHELLSSYF